MTTPAPQRRDRHWGSALFAASLAAWVTFFGLALLDAVILGPLQSTFTYSLTTTPPAAILLFAIFGIPVVLLVCFVVGIPALMLVEWLKLTRWWQWAMVGVAMGLLVVVFTALGSGAPFDMRLLPATAVLMLAGAAAGVAAWANLWLDEAVKRGRRVRQAESHTE